MDALITTASSSFTTTMGFDIGSVVDKGVEFLKLGLGTGLGLFTQALPVLLAIAVVYVVYKIARWGWHRAV